MLLRAVTQSILNVQLRQNFISNISPLVYQMSYKNYLEIVKNIKLRHTNLVKKNKIKQAWCYNKEKEAIKVELGLLLNFFNKTL